MCLILLAWDSHPRYRLVLAANRDEFYARPAAPAGWWPESPHLLAGRDLKAWGTWLGVTRQGRFAALSNYHEAGTAQSDKTAEVPSRGLLVRRFLESDEKPMPYLEGLARAGVAYPGFNLLAGSTDGAYYLSNRTTDQQPRRLEPGLYGLANHLLETPWPKVKAAKAGLAELLKEDARPLTPDPLFALLADRTPFTNQDLAEGVPAPHLRSALSPIFVTSPGYTTRASTVILADREGGVTFGERSFGPGGEVTGQVSFSFQME